MKSILISIQPYWVFLIIAKKMGWNIGKVKTVEVRKNFPKDESWDHIAKIYCSKDKKSFSQIPKEYQPLMEQFLGKVIGEFACDEIFPIWEGYIGNRGDACLTFDEIEDYLQGSMGYGWHISDLVIYDKPKSVSDFQLACDREKCGKCKRSITHKLSCSAGLTRPPQSWYYVESEGRE